MPKYGTLEGGIWVTVNFKEGAVIAAENVGLGFPFLVSPLLHLSLFWFRRLLLLQLEKMCPKGLCRKLKVQSAWAPG